MWWSDGLTIGLTKLGVEPHSTQLEILSYNNFSFSGWRKTEDFPSSSIDLVFSKMTMTSLFWWGKGGLNHAGLNHLYCLMLKDSIAKSIPSQLRHPLFSFSLWNGFPGDRWDAGRSAGSRSETARDSGWIQLLGTQMGFAVDAQRRHQRIQSLLPGSRRTHSRTGTYRMTVLWILFRSLNTFTGIWYAIHWKLV